MGSLKIQTSRTQIAGDNGTKGCSTHYDQRRGVSKIACYCESNIRDELLILLFIFSFKYIVYRIFHF